MTDSSLDAQAKQAFAMLQPLCTRLFELPLAKSDSDTFVLTSLVRALRDAPVAGLQVCMEYVLFPLELLLDTAVKSRSLKSSASLAAESTENTQFRINDKIAEGVVLCFQELLHRCVIKTTAQMSRLLRKLTAAAMLTPDEASEEIRRGAVRSLKGLLLGLMPCSRPSCGCNLITLPHPIRNDEGCLRTDLSSTFATPPQSTARDLMKETIDNGEECLIEFIQSESMSATVGHLLSLFLQISETEALRGGLGSAKLRIDALSALSVLLLKVGTADALAFFLPGVASRLAKAIHSSKRINSHSQEIPSQLSYPRGAAGSSGAVEEGVRALTELLVLVLADERNSTALEPRHRILKSANSTEERGSLNGEYLVAEAALATLSELSDLQKSTMDREVASTAPSTSNESQIEVAKEGLDSSHSILNVSKEEKFERANALRVERNKEWLEHTVLRINTILTHSFTAMCGHSAPSVRLAVTEGATMLMLTCGLTLEGSRSTLLECLLAMACDDWPYVASTAHSSLAWLVTTHQSESQIVLRDVKAHLRRIICRLVQRLPKAMFSGDEVVTVLLCRQLLAAMFFAGPEGVSDCIFQSLGATTQFVTVMAQCFSFNSAFVGSIKQLSLGREGGYVPGISELNSSDISEMGREGMLTADSANVSNLETTAKEVKFPKLPRMPPWFSQNGGGRIYRELSGILRLSGLCSLYGSGSSRHLSLLIETILVSLRAIPSAAQREVSVSGDEQDYHLVGGGKWQRTTATAVSVLNEVFFGASGCWIHHLSSWFKGLDCFRETIKASKPHGVSAGTTQDYEKDQSSLWSQWESLALGKSYKLLSDCVGDILHDYMSAEIWNLPLDSVFDTMDKNFNHSSVHLHVLKDNSALQQVILEGIGVLAVSVGKLFEEHGYLGSVLYLLLERLGCSNYHVSSSADVALHVIPSACGYPSVKALIMASTDHIIDSLCRQLRHLDLYPNTSNMLVAVLRYTGAGQDLVPLLQEPLRNISLQLEIPGRRSHPENTIPMLRALKEIMKAARSEGYSILERKSMNISTYGGLASKESNHMEIGEQDDDTDGITVCDEMILNLKESQRSRQSVEEIIMLSVNACAPLLASKDQHICLLALDVVEVGMDALSCMDKVAQHEKEQREMAMRLVTRSDETSSFDGTEAPKLLPTMHRVWPHLVACLKCTITSVLLRSLKVMASVVDSCGGEFFSRRFQKDAAPKMLASLCQASALKVPSEGKKQKSLSLLPGHENSVEKEISPDSMLKVQVAVLRCITDIARNKKSAPALMGSLDPLAAVAVGLAFGFPALHDPANEALMALSNIDADLIWLLIADIAYGSTLQRSKEISPGLIFPEVSQLLPLCASSKEALWVQLIGKDCSLNIDCSKAWTILSRIESYK